jgi:hypothetical protein
MQAIKTYFLPCTNYRGSRIKAIAEAGSVTLSYDHGLNSDDNHIKAREALCAKFKWVESESRYYKGVWVMGLYNNANYHVFKQV